MRTALPTSSARRLGGFTLVEILVAIFVLSVGLIGIASLQLAGMRQGKGSLQAAQATALAYSLADLMRANPTAYASYVLKPADFNALAAGSGPNCQSSQCTPQQIAQYDTTNWFNGYPTMSMASGKTVTPPGVVSLGPGATAQVICQDDPGYSSVATNCSATSVYRIVVFWDQNRGNTTPATGTDCANGPSDKYDASGTSTELACVIVSLQL